MVSHWDVIVRDVVLKCCHAVGRSSAPLPGWADLTGPIRLGQYRRLSKDYEFLPQSSEVIIYPAMTPLSPKQVIRKLSSGFQDP
jgi:hypothetical protein